MERVPDDLIVTPAEAAELGGRLLAECRPFHAHEVFEAAWKAAADDVDRELWRGLAQIAVGITHARRGNARGAATLLRRGAGHVARYAAASQLPAPGGADIDARYVADSAEDIASRIEHGGLAAIAEVDLRLQLHP